MKGYLCPPCSLETILQCGRYASSNIADVQQ